MKYYGIYRASVLDAETEIARVAAPEANYVDQAIEFGMTYYYRIVAVDFSGNASEFSDMVEIVADIRSSSGDTEKTLPEEFGLQQNYPNPFNPTTRFTFSVAAQADVSLMIYDVLGRKIRTLVDDEKAPGVYNVVWDGRNEGGSFVATGLYFARFRGGEYSEMRKLVLKK